MTTKYQVANDVSTAVRAIEAIKVKIDNLDNYAKALMSGNFRHVELAMEETDPNNPPVIKPLYPQFQDLGDELPEKPPKDALPVGYMKVYPATTGPITTYITTIPVDIAMALVDTLLRRMKDEMTMYHNTINKSIGVTPDDTPKKHSYTIKVKDVE